MKAARLTHSPRLQRVLLLLQRKGRYGATTMQIVQEAGVMAVSACISELRAGGHRIACKFEGVTKDKSHIYRYTLEGA